MDYIETRVGRVDGCVWCQNGEISPPYPWDLMECSFHESHETAEAEHEKIECEEE